jgi:DegV family protein with EDD domain
MAVRIVTDSIADLPSHVAEQLGITVVPLIIQFGTKAYRDGLDMSADQFYLQLQDSRVFPTTSTPPPQAFADVYDSLAASAQEIVVITLSARLSGTYEAALQGRALKSKSCRVEVIDSRTAAMCQGLIVMRAAQAALAGSTVSEIREIVERNVPRAELLAAFDTLEYLRRGGRIGAAKAYLGSMLNVNPLITLKGGVVKPAGRTRSRAKAIDQLYEFAAGYSKIDEMAVENTACPEEAKELIERLAALFPKERIYRSKMTPVIGAHTGPGLLVVAILGDRPKA